jgi:hypothetical protein
MKKQVEDWILLADNDLYAAEIKTIILKELKNDNNDK